MDKKEGDRGDDEELMQPMSVLVQSSSKASHVVDNDWKWRED